MTHPLEARIAALETRLERLEDTDNIKRLQRAYGYYLDKALWDDMVMLFTDDGEAEIGGFGVFKGKDRVHTLFRDKVGQGKDGLPDGRLLSHLQLQGVVTVADDGQTAKGRWRAFIMFGQYGEGSHWAEGPYEMEYRKCDDGVWRISRLHWFSTFYTNYKTGWAEESRPRKPVDPDFPPDAPPTIEYENYPKSFTPPFHYDNPGRPRK